MNTRKCFLVQVYCHWKVWYHKKVKGKFWYSASWITVSGQERTRPNLHVKIERKKETFPMREYFWSVENQDGMTENRWIPWDHKISRKIATGILRTLPRIFQTYTLEFFSSILWQRCESWKLSHKVVGTTSTDLWNTTACAKYWFIFLIMENIHFQEMIYLLHSCVIIPNKQGVRGPTLTKPEKERTQIYSILFECSSKLSITAKD